MKRIIVFITLFISLFPSCNYFMGVKNLGDGYYFDTDQILYTEKTTYNGIGKAVIPNIVLETKNDENYIVIKAENNKMEMHYWIIDKKAKKEQIRLHEADSLFNSYYIYSNVFGPLNLKEFKNKKLRLKIELDLK